MNVIVSDFDDTLFRRNYGLIQPVVDYLEAKSLPIYIVTFRAEDQQEFIAEILAGTKLNIVGYGFASSRAKDPTKKFEIVDIIAAKHNVVEVLDDDEQVVLGLTQRGYIARQIKFK